MRSIKISNGAGVCGYIYPEYGGMLGRVTLHGKEIFAMDEARLSCSPILAGGNPVLFPFPSKTENDTYTIDGAAYHMPFHGLVAAVAYEVEQAADSMAVLSITNTPSWQRANYPFEFKLQLVYEAVSDGVRMTATAHNFSAHKMPHCFGWHCYFTATDKSKIDLALPMRQYIDYTDGQVKQNNSPNLCVATDYVFFDKTGDTILLTNHADGYAAELTSDSEFEVATVCTLFDGRLCVEPWLGLPNSANTGKYLQWVPPGQACSYTTAIRLREIG